MERIIKQLNRVLFVIILVNTIVCFYYLLYVYDPGGKSALVAEDHPKEQKIGRALRHRIQAVRTTKDPLNIPGDPIDYSKRKMFRVVELDPNFASIFEPESSPTSNFIKVSEFVHVYSAYYDIRNGGYIRRIGVSISLHHGVVKCVFPSNKTPVSTLFSKSGEDHSLPYAAQLISCAVPGNIDAEYIKQNGVVLMGIIGNDTIETKIEVNVPPNVTHKQDFAVCIPPLYGNISLTKRVEFISVSKILGVEHFTFYDYDMHENLTKLLNIYQDAGMVTVKPWKHTFTHTHLWYYGQSATVWDCMYHNMAYFNYIALNDIDEFIVPRSTDRWTEMIEKLKSSTLSSVAAYRFQSSAFDNTRVSSPPIHSPEVRQLVTLDTVIRDKTLNPMRSKLIVDPQKVFEVGIHTLYRPFTVADRLMMVDERDAILHHYRWFGMDVKEEDVVEDRTIWKHFDNITSVMDEQRKWLKTKDIYIR